MFALSNEESTPQIVKTLKKNFAEKKLLDDVLNRWQKNKRKTLLVQYLTRLNQREGNQENTHAALSTQLKPESEGNPFAT